MLWQWSLSDGLQSGWVFKKRNKGIKEVRTPAFLLRKEKRQSGRQQRIRGKGGYLSISLLSVCDLIQSVGQERTKRKEETIEVPQCLKKKEVESQVLICIIWKEDKGDNVMVGVKTYIFFIQERRSEVEQDLRKVHF